MEQKIATKNILRRITYPLLFVLTIIVLLTFLFSVGPSETTLFVTFIPLLLVWFAVFFLTMSVATLRRKAPTTLLRSAAVSLASAVMLAFMFSALGRLAFFDVVLLGLLSVVGIFYFQRTWPK